MSTPIPQPSQKAPPPPDDADESSDDEPSSPMDAAAAIAAADAAADEISSDDDSDEYDIPTTTTTTTVPVPASHSVISASLAHAPLIPLKGHSHTSHTTTPTSISTSTSASTSTSTSTSASTSTSTTTHTPVPTVATTSTSTTPTTSTTTSSVIPSTWPTSTSTSTVSSTYTPTVTSYTQPLYGTTSTYTTTTIPTYVTTSHFPPPLYGYSTRIPNVQPPRIPTLPTLPTPTPSTPSVTSPRIISEWTMEDDWILTHICREESDMEKITLLGCFSRAFDLSAITSRWEQLMSDTTWPQRMNALPSSVVDVARQRLKEAKEKQEIRIREHRQPQAVYGNHILGSRPQPIDPLLLPRKSQVKKTSTSTPTPVTGPVVDPDIAWEKYAQRENSALAVLRTHQSDYFITATKTVIGRHAARTTLNAQDIDINLINERDGIKVAREQAIIFFHPSGNFTIKNVGKRPIHVDGWCLGPSKRCRLTHHAVINLNGPTGIFDINHHLIAQCQKMVEKIQAEKIEKQNQETLQPMITTS